MLKLLWRYKWNILAALGVWLAFECWISWAATCATTDGQYEYYKAAKEYCSAFKGPLISTSRFIAIWFGYVLDEHSEALTALATVAIAWFTWTLWKSNEKMWVVTKIAADAAALNARAAIGVELPIIRTIRFPGFIRREKQEDIGKGGILMQGDIGQFSELVNVEFQNVGRTPAFPIQFDVGWSVTPNLGDEPQYLISVPCHPSAVIRDSEGTFDAPRLSKLVELTAEERAMINKKKSPIWPYVSLYYTDFLNEPHEARFCWPLLGKGGAIPPAYTKRT
jgi:hypothetical protein